MISSPVKQSATADPSPLESHGLAVGGKVARHLEAELAFDAEEPGGNRNGRSAREHVLPQDRCVHRPGRFQQPLHLFACRPDLVAAGLAVERRHCGGQDCFRVAALSNGV